MARSAHELVLDLEPAVIAENGLLYRVTVVARAAPDGHWNAWLEFVSQDSQAILRTDIETHQASEADLHRWATTLSDVYLQGALDRARISPAETAVHRRVIAQATDDNVLHMVKAFEPFELFALGEHVLRRELQLLRRSTLLALIINHSLNPRALDLARFTKPQLVAFIMAAIEAHHPRPDCNPERERRVS